MKISGHPISKLVQSKYPAATIILDLVDLILLKIRSFLWQRRWEEQFP